MLRSGGDTLDEQSAEDEREHRVGRQSQREQRDERGLRAGIVGRLGAGDALDGTATELLGVARPPLLGRVGGEGGDHAATAGQQAEEEADQAAAGNRSAGSPQVLTRGKHRGDRGYLTGGPSAMLEGVEQFAETE